MKGNTEIEKYSMSRKEILYSTLKNFVSNLIYKSVKGDETHLGSFFLFAMSSFHGAIGSDVKSLLSKKKKLIYRSTSL